MIPGTDGSGGRSATGSGSSPIADPARVAGLLGWLAVALLASAWPATIRAHPSAYEQVEHLSAAIRARPDDPANYLRRGQAYSNEGHYAEALADFEKAGQLGDPEEVAFDLGVLRYRMGDLVAARRQLDRWLERHPGHARALEYRARVARDAGDRAGALADYRAYFDVQPHPNPGDYVSAAQLLADGEAGGEAEALAMLDSGIARLGPIPQLQRPAIALERTRGNLAGALARLETLRPSLGESPDWKLDRAELLLQRGERREAMAELEAADSKLSRSRRTKASARSRERLARLRDRADSAGSGPTRAP